MKRAQAGSLRIEDVGKAVELAGWVHRHRDFGELIFVDLRERSGVCQLVFDEKRLANSTLVGKAKDLRQEFVILVRGVVHARIEEQRNPNLPTGDVEIVVSDLEVLSRSETPPFTIDDETTAIEETRLRYRYLDLRRPVLAKNMILRDAVCHRVRDFMHANGFLEVETPILTKSTPEGARDFLVPSRVNKGRFYALPQSPQIFKQLLMVSGLERYYQIAKCFRDEDLRADRQLEFTQVDIEASFIDEPVVYDLIERLFAEVFPLIGVEPSVPFPRLSWRDAMERFGIDRPDMRFGLELIDISDVARTIDFPPFSQTFEHEDGTVRAIVVPGASEKLSRKRLDELAEHAKKHGASGLIWVKFSGETTSSMRKYLDDEQVAALRSVLEARDEDVALVVAGRWVRALEALGAVRLKVARDEGMIPENEWKFLWVTDFPLFEHDESEGRYYARHHPFTSPREEDLDRIASHPGEVMARAYDVVLNGIELGGGSIRIHRTDIQRQMFRALGIGDEEARERFGFLLDAFRFGAPPHGGIALGLDRIVMLMADVSSIRDVIAFPKTTSGLDLMTDAPSSVDDGQLAELGIALRKREDD